MLRFLTILFIAGLIAFGVYLLRPRLFTQTEVAPPPPEPVVRLSRFIDSQITPIFAPLSNKENAISTHELLKLREGFKDSLKQRDGDPRELQLAIRLCDNLLASIDSRATHLKRLKSAEAALYVSMEPSSTQKKDKTEKKEYFIDGVKSSWTTESKRLRNIVDKDYTALRSMER